MKVDICKQCNNKLAIADGLCNICSEKALSQQIREAANAEDNDLKELGLYTKALREKRLEKFEDYYTKLEQNNCIIIPFNGQKVIIDTQTDKFGIVDYFPKANKILIRKDSEWKTQGLKWIINNLLK